MGFVAPWDVGSSQTRDRVSVPCIARWILNHWAAREALFNSNFRVISSIMKQLSD